MRKTNRTTLLLIAGLALALPACSINVKKGNDGDDKRVDISTPVGGIHVSKDANVADTGLSVYPGAWVKPQGSDGSDKSANVNISSFGYGLRVVALEYQSNDAPVKLVAYYKDQLKKYGDVLECHVNDFDVNMDVKNSDHSSDHSSDHGSDQLTCSGSSGSSIELKVGTKENQHIVAVRPDGKGSSFALVYLRTHGKEADI
jgi:hypothetical protein